MGVGREKMCPKNQKDLHLVPHKGEEGKIGDLYRREEINPFLVRKKEGALYIGGGTQKE